MRIFNLLNAYTSKAGSWSIEYNDHKITYCTPAEHYIAPEDDGDELDGIDTKQDIYRLYWFNNTPVGHYCILANSIEELEEKIINVIQDENLTKYHNKEKIMTDKEQIIINGMDVSKCIHLDRYFLPNNNTEFKDCALSGLYYGEFEHSCKDNPDCYFKRLARKTQECEDRERDAEQWAYKAGLTKGKNLRYEAALKDIAVNIDKLYAVTLSSYPLTRTQNDILFAIKNIIYKTIGRNYD